MSFSTKITLASVLALSTLTASCGMMESRQQSRAETRVSESEARAMLQQRGYTQVGDLDREGYMYEGNAVRNGQPVQVRIDSRTGTITEQR